MLTKHTEIDFGLSVLCSLAKPGETLCQQDIADVCGCSKNAVFVMEKNALKKLKSRIRLYDHLEPL